MFFLGLLSLIQIWFLPGFLALSFLRRINIYDKLIIAFPLSIILNYIFIFLLILFKLYNFYILIIFVFLELAILVYIYRYDLKKLKNFKHKIDVKKNFYFLDLLIFLLLVSYFILAISNIGEITFPGDPLVMWDAWAKSFAQGIIPKNTMDYPQAYPILMSLTYVLIGTIEIEFFSRSVGLAYPLMIWVIMIRIQKFLPKIEKEIKLTLFLITLLTLNQFRHTLFIGYVDPILVFASVSLGYLFILSFVNKFKQSEIILLCLISILPGLLKQTSLYLTFAFPLIFFFLNYNLKKNFIIKTISIYSLFFLLILSPWYFYKIYLFNLNEETLQLFNLSFFSNTNEFVNNQYNDLLSTIFINLKYGLNLIFGKFYLFVLFLFILGFFKNYYSKLITLIVLPYFFIWANVFANDARNFAFMLPLVSFVLSCGIFLILNILNYNFSRFLNIKINNSLLLNNFLILGFIIASVYFVIEKRSADVLIKKQYEKSLKRTNYPDVNILLYNYFDNKNIENYHIIMYDHDFTKLPNFETSINLSCQDNTVDYLKKNYDKKIYYLIKTDACSNKFMNYFNDLKSKKIIFKNKNHIFWKNK